MQSELTTGRVIDVRDAQIKTASVEIKSLTVSGKQVTQAVFKQLIRERIIAPETAELRGVAWGLVNYFPKPCKPDHLHVVWQKGDELRRDCVRPMYRHQWQHRIFELRRRHSDTYISDYPQWEEKYPDDQRLVDELCVLYQQHYEELAALPQLFIAV
jgi:hypothetical protein